ncbi:MAG TPA: hypothetical protein VIM62_02260, partial [Acidobacteriaceae bacterium]
MQRLSIALAAVLALTCVIHCAAQAQPEKGYWRAASNTAASITGDISISDARLTINFKAYSLAHIRSLKPVEVAAVFDEDINSAHEGALYRLIVPASTRFLHRNTLCGSDDTQWMATYLSGKTLQVAFFSGDDTPVFTIDAISSSQRVCGTY